MALKINVPITGDPGFIQEGKKRKDIMLFEVKPENRGSLLGRIKDTLEALFMEQ